ncbi:MAG: hypothetical protein E7309_07150 [Butyrivibrio sp.]|nr:hypothetical protein [Butyrivibrio sp.]
MSGSISNIQEYQKVYIDTCTSMSDGFPLFVDANEVDLMANNQKLIVKSVVMAELYRLMASNDEDKRSRATRAVSIIGLHRKIFLIEDERITAESILKAFADAEFISEFSKNRIKYKMALLTNDYGLGKDISNLNNLKSCYGKQVDVFKINKDGYLEIRRYDETNKTGEAEKTETQVVVNTEYKTNWAAVIIAALASFAFGAAVDRYGEQAISVARKTIRKGAWS